jgi:hypothetical protein
MTKYKFSDYPGWRIINFILHNDNCIRELFFLELDSRTLMKSGSVKLVLLGKMTTERPFNVKSTTKKNKTHPSQSIIFSLMLRAKRRSNIYQFDSLWFDVVSILPLYDFSIGV